MDASCTDKRILPVQANPVPYDKSAAGYKSALEKGDIWQHNIGVEIGVNGERTIDLCRFSVAV